MATGIQNAIIIEIDVTANATGVLGPTYVLPRGGQVIDAWVICTATSGGGGLQVDRQALGSGSFNALTSLITCDTVNAVARPSIIFNSQAACSATDVLRVVAAGAGDRGKVYICYLPPVVQ